MNKKLVEELSIDDLIALVEGTDEEIILEKISDASKFIYELGIKNGREKITAELIYHTYKGWKGWNQKRQAKPYFFRDFNKYFEKQRGTHGTFYYLSPKPFDLSEETFWLVRKEIREAKAKTSKKTSR